MAIAIMRGLSVAILPMILVVSALCFAWLSVQRAAAPHAAETTAVQAPAV